MGKCSNCGAAISCGCQRRQLDGGKSGCTRCVNKSTPTTQKTDSPIVKQR